MEINSISFIGLGLIGGSIAKTIKKKYPKIKLYALTHSLETMQLAHQDGITENEGPLTTSEYANTDIIFFCSPVGVNVSYLKEFKPFLGANTILTDVGSVKGDIHKAIDELGLTHCFIGGHPMAGSEAIGYPNSTDHLLENAYYILTRTDAIDCDVFNEFKAFISSLDAITLEMTPKEHDHATAAISHVPHLISASLVNMVEHNDNDMHIMKTIAAGGFRDITRISSSSSVMWQHICLTNKDEILNILSSYKSELTSFEDAVRQEDGDKILALFSNAKEYRDSLPIRNTGMLPTTFEFFLDIEDEAGGIATVAAILANQGLSIKNIGIIHNREFEDGALHIEMYDDKSKNKAIELLNKRNYKIFKR